MNKPSLFSFHRRSNGAQRNETICSRLNLSEVTFWVVDPQNANPRTVRFFLPYSMRRTPLWRHVEIALELLPLSQLSPMTPELRTISSWKRRTMTIFFIPDKHWPKTLPPQIPSERERESGQTRNANDVWPFLAGNEQTLGLFLIINIY